MRNWTEEELVLLLKKRAERLERICANANSSDVTEKDDDGVMIGLPDFLRNRVSPEQFNAKLAGGRNFRGYDLSITPVQIPIKQVNHA